MYKFKVLCLKRDALHPKSNAIFIASWHTFFSFDSFLHFLYDYFTFLFSGNFSSIEELQTLSTENSVNTLHPASPNVKILYITMAYLSKLRHEHWYNYNAIN